MRHLLPFITILAACSPSTYEVGDPGDDDGAELDAGPDALVLTCDTGRAYTGFGGVDLTVTRAALEAGVERARVKPFTALAGDATHLGDYARVLGTAGPPSVLRNLGATFFNPAPRWAEEPRPGAINVYAAYRAAFQGCKTATASGSDFAAAPDATSAREHCTTWQTTFWRRVPGQSEVDRCSELALTGTAGLADVRLRWATACASVLTSAGFLTY